MLVVGDNLKALMDQYSVVDDERCFDETSISLQLDRQIVTYEVDPDSVVVYGNEIPPEWIKRDTISDAGYTIPAKSCFLGCSRETVNMPLGYMGFIQTKGSLARLFVVVQCTDGQVDSGYSGKVTFEICNLSPFAVKLFYRQKVAQLFIVKTSTRRVKPYSGRYQSADGPTVYKPE